MRNGDINARFEDWLLSPAEGPDFEAKSWLDVQEHESRGILAKALIALENHGGGYLVIGYEEDEEKRLRPDPKRPESLEQYNADAINAIVKRCAEPSFHVEVSFQRHPKTQEEYPLLRVAGRSKVPVRSCSSTPRGSLRENIYYVRRPGPESDGPQSAAERDQLMRRCVMNQREEIVGVLRAFLPSGGEHHPRIPAALHSKFMTPGVAKSLTHSVVAYSDHSGKAYEQERHTWRDTCDLMRELLIGNYRCAPPAAHETGASC